MQLTKLITGKQVNNLNSFANYIHKNIEPTLVDDALFYVLNRVRCIKSEEDRVPSGDFYLLWTKEHIDNALEVRDGI